MRDGEAQHFTCLASKARIDAEGVVRSSRPPPSDYDGPLATRPPPGGDDGPLATRSPPGDDGDHMATRVPPSWEAAQTVESQTQNRKTTFDDRSVLETTEPSRVRDTHSSYAPVSSSADETDGHLPKCVYFHLEPDSVPRFPFTFHTSEPPGSDIAILTVKIFDVLRQLDCKLYLCSLIPTQFGPDFAVKVNAHVVAVPPQHMGFAESNFVPLDGANEILCVDPQGGAFIILSSLAYNVKLWKRFGY